MDSQILRGLLLRSVVDQAANHFDDDLNAVAIAAVECVARRMWLASVLDTCDYQAVLSACDQCLDDGVDCGCDHLPVARVREWVEVGA